MANNRKPLDRAKVEGSTERNPKRYRDRSTPTKLRALGEPYPQMSEAECEAWKELQINLPWLKSSHRQITRLTCYWMARLDEQGELSITATRVLVGLLSKLGATPVDQCRLSYESEEEDLDDEFFVH